MSFVGGWNLNTIVLVVFGLWALWYRHTNCHHSNRLLHSKSIPTTEIDHMTTCVCFPTFNDTYKLLSTMLPIFVHPTSFALKQRFRATAKTAFIALPIVLWTHITPEWLITIIIQPTSVRNMQWQMLSSSVVQNNIPNKIGDLSPHNVFL